MNDELRYNPGARDWRGAGRGARASGKRSRGRGVGLAAILMILLGALAAFLFWFFHRFPDPELLSIAVFGYEYHRWPVNPLAEAGSKGLDARFPNSRLRGRPYASQSRDALLDELAGLRAYQSGRPVIVHLSCLARRRGDAVYFLPADARPEDAARWIRLTDVLDRIALCGARDKLLILETMHPTADPRLGILTNDVSEGIEELLEQRERKNGLPCLVLCACARGEAARASEYLGLPVLDFYLDRGLAGEADGALGKKDGVVTLRELGEYLKLHVDAWTSHVVGARQRPTLIGEGDIKLAEVKTRPPVQPSPPGDYPPVLKKGWDTRDDLRKKGAYRYAYGAYRKLEARLLWVEQFWRGGIPPPTDLKEEIDDLEANIKKAREQIPDPQPRSLALAAAGSPTDSAAVGKLRIALQKLVEAKDQKEAEPFRKEIDELLKNARKESRLKSCRIIWDSMGMTEPSDRPDLWAARLLELKLLDPPETPETEYAEIGFLRRLGGLGAAVSPPLARDAIACVDARESCLARCDAEVFPWVQFDLQHAVDASASALALLPQAAASASLKQASDEFDRVTRSVSELRKAHASRALARILLPAYGDFLMRRYEGDFQHLETPWMDAVTLAEELDGLLASPPHAETEDRRALEERLEKVRASSSRLGGHLTTLLAGLGLRWGDQDHQVQLSPDATLSGFSLVRRLEALLETPFLSADDRVSVWKTKQEAVQGLHAEVDGGAVAPAQDLDDHLSVREREKKRAATRLQMARALLTWAGVPGARGLPELGPGATETAADQAGGKLLELWHTAKAEYEKASGATDAVADSQHSALSTQYSLCLALDPLDFEGQLDPARPERDPSGRLMRDLTVSYLRWLETLPR